VDSPQQLLGRVLSFANQILKGLRPSRAEGARPFARSDTGFAPGFYKLLRRAVAIGRRRPDLKDTTLAQYRADLDRNRHGWSAPAR